MASTEHPLTSVSTPGVAVVAEYIAHGATSEIHVRAWYLRDAMDFGWATIAGALNRAGERRPSDGAEWTPSTARTFFGEPPRRRT